MGEAPFRSPALELPLGGRVLTGAALVRQVEAWVQQGTLEPSAGRALAALATDKAEWLDLRGRHFVLLGAGSAMGPAALLLRCGATVHAVDLPRPAVWRRLIAVARASPGRLVVPVRAAHGRPPPPGPGPDAGPDTPEWLTEHGGCDLLADAPAVAAWIATQAPSSPLVVGTYVYLDGALFARVAAASDAILAAVCAARGGARAAAGVTIAHLLSPTEAHVVPEEAAAAARARGQQLSLHSVWEQPIRVLSRERYLEPNRPTAVPQADGSLPPLRVQDSFVWQQVRMKRAHHSLSLSLSLYLSLSLSLSPSLSSSRLRARAFSAREPTRTKAPTWLTIAIHAAKAQQCALRQPHQWCACTGQACLAKT